jgi:outer membrane protein OmpA-like peptidoglycan-associated protein
MRNVQKAAIIFSGCAVIAFSTPASAQWASQAQSQTADSQVFRPYVNLGVGANWLEGLQITGNRGNTVSLNYDVGPLGLGAVGVTLPYNFRAEVEYGYRHSEAKNITLPSGGTTPTSLGLKANAGTQSFMVNGYYDFNQFAPSLWGLVPHVGAGVGAANVKVNNLGTQWPFAWQAMAGVEYPLTYNAKIGLEYRFLGTESLNLKPQVASLISSHANYYDHAVILNVRWTFGAPPPPPPEQPAMAPAAPPAVAPHPPPTRDFTVYFDFNKTTLTPEARSVIQQAAAAAREAPVTHIQVVGHTDTVGSAKYNQRLSERRAEVVRAELIKDGVPADSIMARGAGMNELAVPTAAGVKEPRNRRSVIIEGGPGT